MTLEEKTIELQSQFPPLKVEQIIEILKNFTPDEETVEDVEETTTEETKEEVKEPAVAEKDTTVTAEKTEVSEPLDSGDGELPFQDYKFGEFKVGMSEKQMDATWDFRIKYETVAKQGEVYSPENDPYQYKFEVNPESKSIDFYYKPEGEKDFINQSKLFSQSPEENYLDLIKIQYKLGVLKENKYKDLVKKEKERLANNEKIKRKNELIKKYNNFSDSISYVYNDLAKNQEEIDNVVPYEVIKVEDKNKAISQAINKRNEKEYLSQFNDAFSVLKNDAIVNEYWNKDYYTKDYNQSSQDKEFIDLMFGANLSSVLGEKNYKDFLGYLHKEGNLEDLKNRYRKGQLGTYGMSPEDAARVTRRLLNDFNFQDETFGDFTGASDAAKLELFEVARQRTMSKVLQNFLLENQNRNDQKLYIGYVLANPDKFKEFDSSAEGKAKAIKKAKELIQNEDWNEERASIIPVLNYQGLKSYTDGFFSKLKNQNERTNSLRNQKIAERQKEGNWSSALNVGLDQSGQAVADRIGGFIDFAQKGLINVEKLITEGDTSFSQGDAAFDLLDVVKGEMTARTIADPNYVSIQGKTITDTEGLYGIKGTQYIIDDGAIYNVNTKTPIGERDEKTYLALKEALEKSNETDYSISGAGSLVATMSTVTGLAFDLLATRSIGGATTKLGKVTGLKNLTKIPKQRLDGALYWSSLGYVQTKNDTYSQLITAGVSKEKARELSETAGLQGAGLYGVFSLFSPTEKYLSSFSKNAGIKNAVKTAVKQYKNNGGNFGQLIKTSFQKIKPGQKALAVVEENIEEGLQLGGETLGINSYINREIGRDVMDSDISVSDAVNNVILSSAASYSAASAKMPNFASSDQKKIESLYALGQNKELANKFLSNLVQNGEITTEQQSEIMQQAKAVINQSHKIPDFVGPKASLESSIILQEIADLENRLKNIDPAFQDTIKLRIQERREALSEVVKPELEKSKAREAAKKNADLLEASFETFTTQDAVDTRKAELMSEGGEVVKSVGYGEAITTADGKTFILINDQVAGEDNVYTTDQHEVLHPFWEQALKGNPDLAISFGKALMNEFLTNTEISGGAKFLAKFQQYINDPDYSAESTWSEVIPLMSEYLASGDVQYNPKQEAWYKRIGKFITDFLKDPTNKQKLNLSFDTGKDVFDFLVAYNTNTAGGKSFTETQLKVAKDGAKGKLVEEGFKGDIDTEAGVAIESTDVVLRKQDDARLEKDIKTSVAKESKRVEDSQEVQRLYDEQGVSAAMDIIEKFKPITSKIVESRSQAPNFDRQLLTDEIETGKRGILDLVMEYKPESGVPLAAYINKFLPARAIEASKRVLGEEFTTDVTEAKGVIAEEVTEVVEEKPTKLTKPSSLLPAEAVTEITEQVKEKIKGIDPKNMTFKKLGDLAPEVIAREIGIPVKKLTDPRANLSKSDATAIQQFVNKNADKLLRILPEGSVTEAATDDILGTSTGVPTGLLKAFYTKGKRSTRGAGLTPFIKNKNIGKADFLEAFGIVEGKKAEGFSARSPQAQALKGIASLYGRLVTNEVSRSPEVGLKPKTKQRVAAGKSKAMASKRFESQNSIEADKELNNLFIEAAQAKDINAIAASLGLPKITVNDSNREAKQKEMLEFIKQGKIPSVVFIAAKFGNFGRKKVKGKYIDIPARGGLYFGSKDPAYQEALKAARENDALYPNLKRPKRVNIKKAFTEAGDIQAKANMDFLNEFTNILNDAVNKDGMPIEMAALFITSSYQATTGAIKIAAGFKYKSSKFEYAGPDGKASDNKGVKYREEHTIPASVVGANLILAINNNAVKPTMDAVRKNFYQIQLSKKDDTKLDKANLGSTLPQGQSIFNNPIGRLAAAGINLQTIVNPETGKTIAEENRVAIDKELYSSFGTDAKTQAAYIQNEQIVAGFTNPDLNVKAMIDALVTLAPSKAMASKRDSEIEPSSLSFNKFEPVEKVVENLGKADQALNKGRRVNPPVKKIRVFDFDDTLARSNSKVIVIKPMSQIDGDMLDIVARRKFKKEFENLPSYKQGFMSLNGQQQLEVLKETPGATTEINATQFAEQAADLEAQGATFDFSQFEQVIDGKKGPLFNVAKKIADTRGTEDLFVLTARPQEAAGPIKQFMQSLGIDIPLSNITGLGDGTAQAKARWIVDKAADGYNDFYFADDATKNVKAVKNVLSQLDVKSKVQQARASKRQTFDTIVNDMIFDSSGIETYKQFSAAKAKTVGANKGKYNFLIPASAEDFTGLLYKMLGKGKKGDAQMAFLKTNLLDPYMKAEDTVVQAKMAAANDFMALKQQFPGLPKTFRKETGIGGFTYQHAIRTYIWTQQGMSIPGLSKADIRKLNAFIKNDPKLQAFADQLISIQKGKPYPEPGKDWLGGNLTTDIIGGINKVSRAEAQQEFRENLDIIFSPENLNKMEAAYGTRWRRAMEDSIRRMKAGTNRPIGSNPVTEKIFDWLNNSVGAVMFLNTRSALLQTISAVNFINWGDNNIVAAGKAFANQKQYWKDFMSLMNSDYLTQRRNGLKINVSESEIADAVKDSKNKPRAAIAFLLSKGFVMTRFADSFAIATGGATFYRNRIKKYIKEGMDQKLAEEKAFDDFRALAEENQQSSDPSKISMQQASAAGRVILAWANTPMQYARIQKRSAQDLIAGRGDWKTHVSKIAYYGFVQNLIFNALQQALFAIGFGDDDEDEDPKKKARADKKIARVANGMLDSQLKGLGVAGTAVSALKNMIVKLYDEHGKRTPEYEAASVEALGFSPPLNSKYRKLVGGLKSFSWNRKEMKEKGFSLDNPAYLAGAQIISAFTNVPVDRVVKKANNVRGLLSNQTETWQKVALGLGWGTYDIGLPYYGGWDKPKDPTPEEIKQREFDTMKKDTKTSDQVQMLLDLGLDKKQIKALRYEDARVKKIIELQNKKKDGITTIRKDK
jgi:hypothetical protein